MLLRVLRLLQMELTDYAGKAGRALCGGPLGLLPKVIEIWSPPAPPASKVVEEEQAVLIPLAFTVWPL